MLGVQFVVVEVMGFKVLGDELGGGLGREAGGGMCWGRVGMKVWVWD